MMVHGKAEIDLPDGVHSVSFQSTDQAGNSSTISQSIKVDTTPPTLSFSSNGTEGNSGWHISQVETSILSSDSVSGIDHIEYSYNGGSWQTGTSVISNDGVNTIDARVYDLAGNVSTDTLEVKVDTSAPSLDPIIPAVNGLNGWIVGPSVSVSANSSDLGSGLASALVSVDGGEWQDSAVLPDGESTVVFKVEDAAGNIATTSRTLKIDTTAPDLSFSTSGTPGNPGWYLSQTETSVLYDDDTSGIDHVEYRQNGSSWQNTGTILSMDGVNTIEARIYDLAGNVTNETLTVKVDTERPSLTLSKSGTLGNSGWYVSNVTTTIEASDQTSGVDIVQYNSNNTTWNTGSTITSTDGVNNIDIEAYDAAGNMATRFTQIKVDTVAPVVDPVVPTPDGLNDWFVTAPVAISVNGSDDLSGLESATVSTDTETWQENLDLSDGSHTVSFRSTDVAGNITTVTRDVKVDTVAPLISASKSGTLGNSGWYISQVKTDILPADTTSGIDSIQYNQNGTGWNTGSSVTSDQGINSIDIVVYDVAGNRSTDSVQVKVDTVAPAVNPVIPSPNGLNGWFKTAPVDISVWGFDALSGLESASMSTDTETWEDTAAVSDGVKTVSFRSVDVAGNITMVTREVKVDTIAPSISASMVGTQGNSGWYTSQVTTNIVADDDISGLDRIQYAQNGSGWTVGSSIVSGDGINNIYVSAYDAAGNVVDHYIEVKVDTVAPTVNPIVPAPNGLDDWFVTGPVPVSAIGSDAISGLSGTQVSVNGGEWQNNAFVSDGANVVKFRSTDTAGNTTTVTREVKVDTIAPTLSFSRTGTAGKSDWFISQVTTEIEGSDGASGIDRIQYNQNNTGWQDGSSVNSSDGINTIEVNIYDAAGNKTTGSTQVKVDTIAPSFTVSKTGTAGKSDWYVSPVTVDIVSDDGGSGLESIQHNQNNTGWQDGSSFVSKDGVNSIDVQVSDAAGNVYIETIRVKVDTVPPSFASSNSGTDGASGWYISQTTTNILPEDNTPGIDHVEYSQNGGDWQTGTTVKSQDGINAIDVKIYDLAGNLATGQLQVKVDTGKPTSSFISPVNGSQNNLASGVFSMSGSSSDALSGIKAVELSYDGGKTWIPLVLSSNQWSYDFDTTVIPNGTYNVVVRTFDLAGNTDVAAIPGAHISLNISNGEIVSNDSPPHIKLTTEWFIWESGSLSIQADSSSLKNGRVVISDPQNRWPKVEMSFEDKYPSTITWDRRFANGILAPSGNYKVTVYACNISDSCAEKSATIKIPVISIPLPPPESTPVPEYVSPEQQTVTTEASVQPNILVGTAEASSVGVVAPEPPSTESQVEPHPTSARTPPYIRFGGECLVFLMLICLVVAILRWRRNRNTQLN